MLRPVTLFRKTSVLEVLFNKGAGLQYLMQSIETKSIPRINFWKFWNGPLYRNKSGLLNVVAY